MMRKMLCVLCAVIFLSACSCSSGAETESNGMKLHFENQTDIEVYGIELHLGDTSSTVVNADGSAIAKGDNLVIEVLREDFTSAGHTSFDLYLLGDQNGKNRMPVDQSMSIDFIPGEEWHFKVTGGKEGSAALHMQRSIGRTD